MRRNTFKCTKEKNKVLDALRDTSSVPRAEEIRFQIFTTAKMSNKLCVCVRVCLCVSVCLYVCVYIYICIYIYIIYILSELADVIGIDKTLQRTATY